MTILIFFLVLFVLVLVHEWGHFIAAKKTGMRVDEFGIGFPPKLFGVKKGETEYSFNLFPIGGFVKIYGSDEPVAGESGEVGEKDQTRAFTARPRWAQALVLIAGVAMNIIFAWFLFFVVLVAGVPTAVDEAEAGPEAKLVVLEVLPEGPAAEAGLTRNAVITSLSAGPDMDQILNPSSFRAFTEDHGDMAMQVTYLLGNDEFTTEITPQTGVVEDDPDRPAVGVALSLIESKRTPFYIAWWDALKMTGSSLVAITVGVTALLTDAVVGEADFSQVAGPVGIVGLVGEAAEFGFTSLLLFTAFISLNLAIINLLPVPALDGGRLVFVAIEAVTRKPINPIWVYRLNAIGFILLILLMVAVTFSDVSKLL